MTAGGHGWESVRFDELDSIPLFEGLVWHPVRRRLGIRAFGINAYSSEGAGHTVVEEHDETGGGAGGHEEIYVVISGRATFTVGGETLDAPAGTLVFVSDPAVHRKAVAEEEGTLVLAIGGEPGVHEVSPWEWYFAAMPAFREERWDDAIALMEEGLVERPGNPALLYNLACAESRSGRAEEALAHLRQAVETDPTYLERARNDEDFDPIRHEPDFPA
jgi:mannose-6-phosphate isomerase-like protein (cupin superfamily)